MFSRAATCLCWIEMGVQCSRRATRKRSRPQTGARRQTTPHTGCHMRASRQVERTQFPTDAGQSDRWDETQVCTRNNNDKRAMQSKPAVSLDFGCGRTLSGLGESDLARGHSSRLCPVAGIQKYEWINIVPAPPAGQAAGKCRGRVEQRA